jgi:hypothetical protein
MSSWLLYFETPKDPDPCQHLTEQNTAIMASWLLTNENINTS